jgi:hypothetical protein
MKCTLHQTEASGICVYCGRALCPDCAPPAKTERLICSESCATALKQKDRTLEFLLHKHLQGARVNAVFYLLCGALSAAGAVGAWFYLPSPFLIWFCAGCSFVFFASGLWPLLLAGKSDGKK